MPHTVLRIQILAPALLFLGFAPAVRAQDIAGPAFGFVADTAGSSIRTIRGIPGAALLGDPLWIDAPIRDALISPDLDYAIAIRADDGTLVAVDLTSSEPVLTQIGGGGLEVMGLALSPTGSVAAIYDASGLLFVVGGLPAFPRLVGVLNASGIEGSIAELDISDDGTVALLRFDRGVESTLWTADTSGVPREIVLEVPGAVAFLPGTTDAVIVDEGTETASLVRDVNHRATRIPLLTAPPGLVFSVVAGDRAGGRVFLADEKSGMVAIVDLETLIPVWLDCRCRPSHLVPVGPRATFSLGPVTDEPLVLLVASADSPRVWIVPPDVSSTESQ